MGEPVELDDKQKKLKMEIDKKINKINELRQTYYCTDSSTFDIESIQNLVIQNAKLCLELHISLKRAGKPPVHSKHMLRNRAVASSESIEFYSDLLPQEDLVRFVNDPESNILPNNPDVTMGSNFKIKIYTKRWKHDNFYKVMRTADGWYIDHISIGGHCDHTGAPFLYKNFNHDYVNYPHDVGSYMSSIWERARSGATEEEVAEMLKTLAKWISECEKNSPDDILF